MPSSIYFARSGYIPKEGRIMGRHIAGDSFLKHYLKYSKDESIFITTETRQELQPFLENYGNLTDKPIQNINLGNYGKHREMDTLFFPSPMIEQLTRRRAYFGHSEWSICGITHTTSSSEIVGGLRNLCTSPVYPWDSIICTSLAVRSHVLRVLEHELEFLTDRLGIENPVLPQTPVIPLGVDYESFQFKAMNRQNARQALGISENTFVVLYMGRLSFHAKANPIAMYKACALAASNIKKKVLIIECGWFSNEKIRDAYTEAARAVAPNVRIIRLNGSVKSDREKAWLAADVFCSFSDNIQETFGITPIEAMACGLPVVVSDWSGYKESVRHGKDGFLVSTTMVAEGEDFAYRYDLGIDTYDRYCGYVSSTTEVDIPEAARYFEALISNQELRKEMGEAGRRRVLERYDWSTIIPQYLELWTELTNIRKASTSSPEFSRSKFILDPCFSFGHYATRSLNLQTKIKRVYGNSKDAIREYEKMISLDMVNFASYVIPDKLKVQQLVELIGNEPVSIAEICSNLKDDSPKALIRLVSVLLKYGILACYSPEG